MTNLAFKIYVYACFFTGVFSLVFDSFVINIIADICFLILFISVIFQKPVRNTVVSLFCVSALFLVFVSSVWSVGNENEIITVILTIRQYKNLLLFFIIAYLNVNSFNFFVDIYKKSLYLSVPLSVFQFISADRSNPTWADTVVGVYGVGQSGTLSMLIVIFVIYEIIRRERDGKKIIGPYLILLLPVFLNETKIVFIIFPLVLLYSYLIFSKSRKNVVKAMPLFLLGALLGEFSYQSSYNVSILNIFNSEFLEEYFFVDERHFSQEIDIGRFQRVIYAIDYIDREGGAIYAFGFGQGSSFVGGGSGQIGVAAKEFFAIELHTGSRIQLYNVVLDYGVIGSLIFILFLISIIIHSAMINDRSDSSILATASSVVFFFGIFYQVPFANPVLPLIVFFSYLTLCSNKYSGTAPFMNNAYAKKIRFSIK